MPKRDYYQVLGIPRTASPKEVKQAYRRLARKYHPDVNPGDPKAEAMFKEMNEAHEVLSKPEDRKKYDRYGDQWRHADQFARAEAAGRGPSTWRWESGGSGAPFDFDDESPFGDVFGSLFGGRRSAMRGQDVDYGVDISLEEAFHGTSRRLQLAGPDGGRLLEVKIPPGVTTGSRVRVAAEGGAGVGGGPKGDLYLVIKVLGQKRFERKGDDLYVDVPVDLAEAVLGTEAEVPTMSGKVLLNIPPETQNGRTFRLGGKGMPRLGKSGNGNLFARIKVVLPEQLSDREKEIFAELRNIRRQDGR